MRGNLLISYFISFLLLGILGACRDENPEEKVIWAAKLLFAE